MPDERCRCGHSRDQHGPNGCLEYPPHCHGFELYAPVYPDPDPPGATDRFFAMTEPDGPFDPDRMVDEHLARCGLCASAETRERLNVIADALTTPADDESEAA